MDVSVAVATFGDESWKSLAHTRAVPSALNLRVPVVHIHGDTLHEARNEALGILSSEWVVFLDADDELEPGYLNAPLGADVNVPRVRYVVGNSPQAPRTVPVVGHRHDFCEAECLADGNFIVIGAIARTALLKQVGGFRDFPVYEDWDLWARCWQAGATFTHINAVYRAYSRADSRNRGSLTQQAKHSIHQDIARANGLPVPA